MAQLRTESEINALARERADRAAPSPKLDPTHTGFVGAVVAALPVIVFGGLAGFRAEDDFPIAFAVTVALGFLAPFLYLKHQEREHSKAWAREYTRLRAENDAPRIFSGTDVK